MKIKTKLLIAFITVTVVPLLLIYLMVAGIANYGTRTVRETYGISGSDILFGNSAAIFDRLTEGIQEEVEELAETDPESLENPDLLHRLNRELSARYSAAVVRKGEDIFYDGMSEASLGVSGTKILSDLPEYGGGENRAGIYFDDQDGFLLKQVDFRFADGAEGSFFIVTKMSSSLPEVRHIYLLMVLCAVGILVFAGIVLVFWIYRTLLFPLSRLKEATNKIRDGNLDFTLEVDSDDEIGQLCQDFEEMRIRLKESAEEKIRDDRESKMLISNISHDLRTPLTAIKGYVEGIRDGVASSPEKLDKYLRTIYNKTNDMDRLIDELTLYSKIDTNRIPYNFAKIHVNDYFGDCVEEVGLDMEARGIGFSYHTDVADDVCVIADPEQMKRVINNIIGNSLKYLDKTPGKISIDIRDEGDFILTTIADNGAGIAAADLPKIFDRFYRTDASRNSSRGGSGIGLSIVRKIIEDHGGRIWATSREHEGTEMHFELRKYQEAGEIEQNSDH